MCLFKIKVRWTFSWNRILKNPSCPSWIEAPYWNHILPPQSPGHCSVVFSPPLYPHNRPWNYVCAQSQPLNSVAKQGSESTCLLHSSCFHAGKDDFSSSVDMCWLCRAVGSDLQPTRLFGGVLYQNIRTGLCIISEVMLESEGASEAFAL